MVVENNDTSKVLKKNKNRKWLFFVSSRFAHVDNKGRSAVTGFLASLGIGFGVMALIVIISVMNGFQMGYIESIMEISSYHIRAVPSNKDSSLNNSLINKMKQDFLSVSGVTAVVPMIEAQTLFVGTNSRQSPALIRGIPSDIENIDPLFIKEATITSGEFDISTNGSVVLGSELARKLKVKIGSTVDLFALSGGAETDLFAKDRTLSVTGIFTSGYYEINSSYAFLSLETMEELIGDTTSLFYGIKISNSDNDSKVIPRLENLFPYFQYESWRSYNRSFFGALKIEKNMLMILVFLIFVVVGVNIFNSMRRMVFERNEDIAVLSALGASGKNIRAIFILQGLTTGLKGAIPGLLIGLLICVRMEDVFVLFTNIAYGFQYIITMIFSPENVMKLQSNSIYLYYAKIPARVVFSEVAIITLFGIVSSLVASWLASRNVLKMSVAEVLRDE